MINRRDFIKTTTASAMVFPATLSGLAREKKGQLLEKRVLGRTGEKLSIIALKKFLGGRLPKYMVPEVIEAVDEIPKNANGKIDRRAIKAWVN